MHQVLFYPRRGTPWILTMEENPYESPVDDHDGAAFVPVELVDEEPKYWGFWATIGLSLVVAGVYLAANVAIIVAFILVGGLGGPTFDARQTAESLENSGLLLAVGSILSAPFALLPIWLAIWLRRGVSVREYLALRPVSWGTLLVWLILAGVFLAGEDVFSRVTGYAVTPQFMIDAWHTAGFLPLLWIALIVFAPLVEETFFRGFLFVGLQHSPIGNVGAVVITSFSWAIVHVQYDLYHMGVIFAIGILLGAARILSKSLYVPMAMHAAINVVATIQTGWIIAQG
jgi:membrane protease YdiL (CAAX protease family)